MTLLSFSAEGETYWGANVEGGVLALNATFPQWRGLRQVIEAGAIEEVLAFAEGKAPSHLEGRYRHEMPIPDAEKIICVGVNFPDRNAEYKDGQEAPPNMSLFPRFSRSFTAHNAPLIRPPESHQLDYEGEIVVVIGKAGRRIAEEEALSHIAALTLCNEGTIRDWVRHAKFNVTQGKNWDKSGAIGPNLVPMRREEQLRDIGLRTYVNDGLRQEDRTSRMLFPIARQIAYISTFTTLVPGDMIVTGTPTGAGARFDPPLWLKPGDVIRVEADGIGSLTNTVADE